MSEHFGETEAPNAFFEEPVQESRTETGLPSVYDLFRAEVQKRPDLPVDVVLPVAGRPSLSVRYSADLPLDKLHRWQKAARKKRNDPNSDIDGIVFNSIILQEQCLGLILNGENVLGSDDKPVTFKTDEFQTSLNVMDPKAAIAAIYGRDPYILRAASEVLVAAGYSSDGTEGFNEKDDEEDPLD